MAIHDHPSLVLAIMLTVIDEMGMNLLESIWRVTPVAMILECIILMELG